MFALIPFKLLVPVRLIAVITASSHSCAIFWVSFSHTQRFDQPSKTNSTYIWGNWLSDPCPLYTWVVNFFSGNTFCAKSWKNLANRKSQITQESSVTRQTNFTAHFSNTLISVTSLFAEGENFFLQFFNFLLFCVMCNTSLNWTNDMLQLVNCSTVLPLFFLLYFFFLLLLLLSIKCNKKSEFKKTTVAEIWDIRILTMSHVLTLHSRRRRHSKITLPRFNLHTRTNDIIFTILIKYSSSIPRYFPALGPCAPLPLHEWKPNHRLSVLRNGISLRR